MQLNVKYTCPICADGVYSVKAKGYVLASLWYGNESGVLPNYTAIAYIPLDASGEGSFTYTGSRSIPDEATRVIARLVSADCLKTEEISALIPAEQKAKPFQPNVRFAVMSDLHLKESELRKKAYRTLYALKNGSDGMDALLLAGDMTNDGLPEQFELFYKMLSENVNCPVFSVAGNHDMPLSPIETGEMQYFDLKDKLLAKSEIAVEKDPCGTYAARIGNVEIIGINCVTDYRKFKFPDGQIEWLEKHLDETTDVSWHIILCHAPLLEHNPQRPADGCLYMNKDIRLGRIINSHKNIIFISGHTHFSPNDYHGCVEFDDERNNVFINDGSTCPTTSKWREDAIVSDEWCDGVYVELAVSDNEIKVIYHTVESGKTIARGIYQKNKG